MRRLISELKRFRSDERGVFLVMFGLMAVVLIATSGAVVDFVSIEQARTRAQVALDAAALALQPKIYTLSNATLKSQSQALLVEQIADDVIEATVDTVTTDTDEGILTLEASITVPTYFVALVGVDEITATLISEASRKAIDLEVALVLDNSESMDDFDRMDHLIEAVACLSNILFNDDCASTATTSDHPEVKLAIVPFTLLVNVGTSNASAAWMDRTGGSAARITNDNFDNNNYDGDLFNGNVDRIALMNQMNNVDWGGCVEAREHPHDTNDSLPVAGTATMFTPLFAPDEWDGDNDLYNDYLSDSPASCPQPPRWVWTQTKTSCNSAATNSSSYNSASCNGNTTNQYVQTSELGVVNNNASSTQPTSIYNNTASCSDSYTTSGSGSNRTNRRIRTCIYNFTARELQERLCKYTGATVPSSFINTGYLGPNADCPAYPITPLTPNKATITTAISHLSPQGSTNIHAGTEWGFRVLSPTAPFTEGNPYDDATAKVLIIMTDGENKPWPEDDNMNNTLFYSSYGFHWNQRMGNATSIESEIRTEMNSRVVMTCNNAKAEGIRVYTIGLSVDGSNDPVANTAMLNDCSSGTDYAFFPDDPDELIDVFTAIAEQLSQLRLVK